MPTPHNRLDDSEIDRTAFNVAFFELGLRWFWDCSTYEGLVAHDCERRRLQTYLQTEQSHLLRAYDADFLTDAILSAKQRSRKALAASAPHSLPRFDGAAARMAEVGA
jgi:hypothetical protein